MARGEGTARGVLYQAFYYVKGKPPAASLCSLRASTATAPGRRQRRRPGGGSGQQTRSPGGSRQPCGIRPSSGMPTGGFEGWAPSRTTSPLRLRRLERRAADQWHTLGEDRLRACVWDRVGDSWKGTALPHAERLGSNVVALSDDGKSVTAVDGTLPCLWTQDDKARWIREVIGDAGSLIPRAIEQRIHHRRPSLFTRWPDPRRRSGPARAASSRLKNPRATSVRKPSA